MKEELTFQVVLKPHDDVVPDGFEARRVGAHFLFDTSVHMGVKVPALNVGYVAAFDRHRDAHWNHVPVSIVSGVGQVLLLV